MCRVLCVSSSDARVKNMLAPRKPGSVNCEYRVSDLKSMFVVKNYFYASPHKS